MSDESDEAIVDALIDAATKMNRRRRIAPKVWVCTKSYWDSFWVMKVFSTKEKAEAWCVAQVDGCEYECEEMEVEVEGFKDGGGEV